MPLSTAVKPIKPVSPPSLRVLMHNILFEPDLVQELGVRDGEGE